jgi:hypothetical protein
MTLGDRGTDDRLAAAIDLVLDRAAASLADQAWRLRRRLQESDPLRRLGLDIILSTLDGIVEARACEALEEIPAIRAGEWWMAPGVRAPAGNPALVLAAAGRIVSIQAQHAWRKHLEGARLTARSLLSLVDEKHLEVAAIIAVDDERVRTRWLPTPGGYPVDVSTIGRLADTVLGDLHGRAPYDPERNPRLSRALHAARRCAQQRDQAVARLLDELGDGWLIAAGVRLPGLAWPIGVLAAGPTGVFVCEPAGTDAHTAVPDAIVAARHLAMISRGMGAHITPVVLCDPGAPPHQLQLGDGRRAWALPVDRAADAIASVRRAGVKGHRLRRLRRPASGWEYRVAPSSRGWAYEVRYDLSRCVCR